MKKKWYRSKGIKGFWIVLMHVMAVLGVCCTALISVVFEDVGVSFKDMGKPYVMSEKIGDDVFNEALDIMGGINGDIDGPVLSRYEEGNSNLTYLYVDNEKEKVYTNSSAYSDYRKYEDSIQAIQEASAPYIVVYPTTDKRSTKLYAGTMQIPEANVWVHTLYEVSKSKHYVLAIQVNDKFPAWDMLAQNKEAYDKWSRWMLPAVVGSVVSVLLILTGFLWLTIAAGRKPEDEEVHLNGFDRIFTEVAAVLTGGVWMTGFLITADRGAGNIVEGMAAASFLGIYTMALFLIGYLSLVRRIKAKTLWKNSFLRWFFVTAGVALGKSRTALAKDGIAREKGEDILKKSGNLLVKVKYLCKKMVRNLRILFEFFSRNTGSKVKTILLAGGFMALQLIFTFLAGIYWWNYKMVILLFVVCNGSVLLWLLKKADQRERIMEGLKRITEGELSYKIPLEKLSGEQKIMAEAINNIGSGLDAAVEKSIKDERMKTELITNVSHDIKTPLTSIINYVDLLKRENFTDEKVCGYLDVLEEKAQRLKVLTEDVVEASKASTGNITFEKVNLNFVEMVNQVIGEFGEKLEEKHLTVMVQLIEEPALIYADGRRMWRVLENVFNNVVKYAMEGTRVYTAVEKDGAEVIFSLKNISAQPLNINADELTERFIRGDVARNTEGSGLGLSIAKSLTELQGGRFQLYLDGDLFKVTIVFPEVK